MRLILLLISVLLNQVSFGQIKTKELPLKDLLNNKSNKIKKTNPGYPDSSRYSIKEAFGDSSDTYTQYYYNSSNQLIKEEIRFVGFNGPTLYFLDSLVYDAAGRLIAEYNFELDGPRGNRIPSTLSTTNYDDITGLRLSRKTYNFSNGQYEVASGDSSLYSFDNEGRSTGFEVRQYGMGGELWGLTNKVEINYSGNNLMPIEYIIYFYNNSSQSFVPDQKLTEMSWRLGPTGKNSFLYNTPTDFKFYYYSGNSFIPAQIDSSIIINNQRIAYLSFVWDGVNMDSLRKVEYEYDNNGNLKSETIENYNSNSEWELESYNADSIIYGKLGVHEEKYNTNIFNDVFQGILTSKSYWDYYYPANLSHAKIESWIEIYPNPSNGIWYIKNEKEIMGIELWDIQGKKIEINLTIEGKDAVLDGKNIPSGIFFIRIIDNNGIKINKVFKR